MKFNSILILIVFVIFLPPNSMFAQDSKLVELEKIATIDVTDIKAFEWCPDSSCIVTYKNLCGLNFWKIVDDGLLEVESCLPPKYSLADRLTFSPDGELIAVWGSSNLDIWSRNDNKLLREVDLREYAFFLKWRPDSKQIMTYGSIDSLCWVWNLEYGSLAFKFTCTRAYWNKDGTQIIVHEDTSNVSPIQVLDSNTGDVLYSVETDEHYNAFDWLNEQQQVVIAAGYDTDHVRVWDAKSGQLLYELSHGNNNSNIIFNYTPERTEIATYGDDSKVYMWDAQTGVKLKEYEFKDEFIQLVDWVNDEKWLFITSRDSDCAEICKQYANLWDIKNDKLIFRVSDDYPTWEDLPPHIVASQGGYDPISQQKLYLLNPDKYEVAKWSPDGTMVIIGQIGHSLVVYRNNAR